MSNKSSMGLYHRKYGYATPAKFFGRKCACSRASIRKAKKIANRFWNKYYYGGYEDEPKSHCKSNF